MKDTRDEQFYIQFQRIWRENPGMTFNKALDVVRFSAQQQLWVSFGGVYRILLRILYGKGTDPRPKARRGLKEHVKKTYERLKSQPVFRQASPYFLASFIIAEPAHGFFISHRQAMRIIYKMRKIHHKKH